MKDQMLLKLVGKYQNLVWPVVSLVASLFLLVVVIIPQIIVIFQTNSLIKQTQSKTQFYNNKASFLKQINTASYTQNLNLAESAYPTQVDIPSVVSQIQALVAQSQLQLSAINSVSSFSGGSVGSQGTFDIKIEVLGSSDSLTQFINKLNTAPQVIKLTSLSVSGSRGGLLDANLTLETYYQPLPTTIGNLDQPVNPLTKDDNDLLLQIQKNLSSTPYITSDVTGPRGKTNPFQ